MNELKFNESSRRHLEELGEHRFAPKYNFASTDMLDAESLGDVKAFEAWLHETNFWREGEMPDWMDGFLDRVFRTVPFYRSLGDRPRRFTAIPPIDRKVLARSPEQLVPDDVDLDTLTVYTSSGTTGTSLSIPTDAAVSSKVLVLIDYVLREYGVRLPRGSGKVAVASVFCQDQTLTYPTLSHYLEGAAGVKVNLNPDEWRDPADRARFLTELSPAVVTGSPYSLSVLAEFCPDLQPSAVLSSATHLSEGMRGRLAEVFECPVVDVYSLTEAKFIGAGGDLIAPDLYLEILDSEGRTAAPGERGEITLTGGRNRFLPLLRYRTGDFAALHYRGSQPYLTDLQGRDTVVLVDGDGRDFPSLDVIHALRRFPLVGFSFCQSEDGAYRMEFCGVCQAAELEEALRDAKGLEGKVRRVERWEGKPAQFGRGAG